MTCSRQTSLRPLEVCRRLRSMPELQNIKIVVLSAKGYEADRAQAMAMGADGMINKPFDAKVFVSTILEMISDGGGSGSEENSEEGTGP